jgi:hypothetical protein
MKRLAFLSVSFLLWSSINADDVRGHSPSDVKTPLPDNVLPRIKPSRHAQSTFRQGQSYPRPTRWEYSIMEVRMKGLEQGESLFHLHMPSRSSGRTRDIAKAFREVHIQMTKTSRIDEINALNTLGALGWELVFSQKKEAIAGNSVFYYFKRRI